MPNELQQEPGGWNRVVIPVKDLPGFIETVKKAGLHFRNNMEAGPGGRQIQSEDLRRKSNRAVRAGSAAYEVKE